jgi:beta-lactamase superfamily II metal-dependent hydrolase
MNEELAFEIDFHPVGDGEKGGDAITIQYGRLNSENNFSQKVIVIDGGTLDSGKKVVEHIKNVYKTNTVDLIINTHPDNDHCSGLREIVNNLTVKEMWLHMPWHLSKQFLDIFKDGKITNSSLKERLKDALNIVSELELMAEEKGIALKQPFVREMYDNGVIKVLGPTKDYYMELLPLFNSTPEPVKGSLFSRTFSTVKDVVSTVFESMDIETLNETGETSPENNSSVISLFSYAGKKVLFTGDAGIPAIKKVITIADYNNITLNDLMVLQIPHHGSKRNLSPSILNSIKAESAYISCPKKGDPKHPAKKVTNALIRRGMNPYVTKGNILYSRQNTLVRAGYYSAIPIPFYNQVEE